MMIMNLKLQQKTISKVLPTNYASLIEALLLIGIGALAVTIRARLRIPINIPGHHGLEVMALLMAGRSMTSYKPGTTISTIAASLLMFIPFLGFKDPFLPLFYIIIGFTVDSIYVKFQKWSNNYVFLALLGGIAYMMIPISRLIISLSSIYQYGSFIKHGIFNTIILHFAFGMLGALIGTGITLPFIKKKQ